MSCVAGPSAPKEPSSPKEVHDVNLLDLSGWHSSGKLLEAKQRIQAVHENASNNLKEGLNNEILDLDLSNLSLNSLPPLNNLAPGIRIDINLSGNISIAHLLNPLPPGIRELNVVATGLKSIAKTPTDPIGIPSIIDNNSVPIANAYQTLGNSNTDDFFANLAFCCILLDTHINQEVCEILSNYSTWTSFKRPGFFDRFVQHLPDNCESMEDYEKMYGEEALLQLQDCLNGKESFQEFVFPNGDCSPHDFA